MATPTTKEMMEQIKKRMQELYGDRSKYDDLAKNMLNGEFPATDKESELWAIRAERAKWAMEALERHEKQFLGKMSKDLYSDSDKSKGTTNGEPSIPLRELGEIARMCFENCRQTLNVRFETVWVDDNWLSPDGCPGFQITLQCTRDPSKPKTSRIRLGVKSRGNFVEETKSRFCDVLESLDYSFIDPRVAQRADVGAVTQQAPQITTDELWGISPEEMPLLSRARDFVQAQSKKIET